MRLAMAAAALAWTAPALAQAQPDGATLAAAERLIEVTQIGAQLEQGFALMVPTMAQNAMAQLAASQTTRAMFEQLTQNDYARKQKMEAIFADEFTAAIATVMPRLKREYAREYAAAFTAAELEALIAFFSAGVGGKYIAQTPGLSAKLAASSQRIGMEVGMVAMPKAMQRAKAELEAETMK